VNLRPASEKAFIALILLLFGTIWWGAGRALLTRY